MIESEIQIEIVKYLETKNILFTAIPNEIAGSGKQAMLRIIKHKRMGLRAGSPDLILFLDNARTICLEVKREKGKQQETQKIFETELKNRNHKYYIVRSVDDVKDILEQIYIKTVFK
jgi:hypothetical protein